MFKKKKNKVIVSKKFAKDFKHLDSMNNDIKASEMLNKIYNNNITDKVEIGSLLASIDAGGFALLILIFSLLLIIPTPPPVATIAAIIIMFLSFQMIIGRRKVWLPNFIMKKSISRKTLLVIIEKSNIYLYKLETFSRKRFFIFTNILERIIGIFIFILATITLTPIIFANSVPGMSILIISFGLLNKDGLIIILGFIVGIFSVFVVWAMIVFGKTLIVNMINKFFT